MIGKIKLFNITKKIIRYFQELAHQTECMGMETLPGSSNEVNQSNRQDIKQNQKEPKVEVFISKNQIETLIRKNI